TGSPKSPCRPWRARCLLPPREATCGDFYASAVSQPQNVNKIRHFLRRQRSASVARGNLYPPSTHRAAEKGPDTLWRTRSRLIRSPPRKTRTTEARSRRLDGGGQRRRLTRFRCEDELRPPWRNGAAFLLPALVTTGHRR